MLRLPLKTFEAPEEIATHTLRSTDLRDETAEKRSQIVEEKSGLLLKHFIVSQVSENDGQTTQINLRIASPSTVYPQ